MTGPARLAKGATPRGRVRALLVTGLAGLALLAGVGGPGTLAFWTDTEQIDSADFVTGDLDLKVADAADGTTYAFAGLGFAGMAPTESVAATLTFSNVGSTPFRWQLRGSAGSGLLDQHLVYVVRVGAATKVDSASFPRRTVCDSGVELWSGTLDGTVKTLGAVSSTALGNGDVRTLCVQATLALAAPNSVQGGSTSATFRLDAEQVLP